MYCRQVNKIDANKHSRFKKQKVVRYFYANRINRFQNIMEAQHLFKDMSIEMMKFVLRIKVQKYFDFLNKDIESHFDKQLDSVRKLQINNRKMHILKDDQKYKEIIFNEKLRDTRFEIEFKRLINQRVHLISPIFVCLLKYDNMVRLRPGMITEKSMRNSYGVTIYWCCEEIVIANNIELTQLLNKISQFYKHPAEYFNEWFLEMFYNHLLKIKQNSGTFIGRAEITNNEKELPLAVSTSNPVISKSTQIVTSSSQTHNSSSQTDNSSKQNVNSSSQTDNSSSQTHNSSKQNVNSSRRTDNSSKQKINSSRRTDNSSKHTNASLSQTHNSSSQTHNSSNQTHTSSTQTDNSSNQTHTSSSQTDKSSNQTHTSSSQTDNSSNQTHTLSRQTHTSSRQTDILSRQTDISSRQTDILSRQTDISSRQTDNSSRQTDTSSRQVSNTFSVLLSTSPSKQNTIEDIYFKEINSKSKYSDFKYFSVLMKDDELKKVIERCQIQQFGLSFKDLKPNKKHFIFFVSSSSVALRIHALAEITKEDSKNKNFCLNIIHEELIEVRELKNFFSIYAIMRLDDPFARDLLKFYCKAAQKVPGGLRNIGNSCYMNSILQCLNACFCEREIENILVKLNNDSNLRDKNSLSYDLFSLLNLLHENKDMEIIATDLRNKISLISPKFGTPLQQHAFYNLMPLLNHVEIEISSLKDCKKSIIKETFGLQLKTELYLKCGHKIQVAILEDIFFILSLDQDSLSWKNKFWPTVSLESCWEAEFKSEKRDELLCQTCPEGDNFHKGSFETFVVEFPKVLIIYIDRFDFKNGCENNKKIEFPLDDFVAKNPNGKSESYRAVAFCEHYGTIDSGHYISYVRGKSDDIWFLCSDLHKEHSMGRLKNKVSSNRIELIFYKKKSTTI